MKGPGSIFLAFLLSSTAVAGSYEVPADVSVSLTAEPSEALVPGQPIVFTLSATNNGPDPVSQLVLISDDFVDQFDTSVGSNDCQGLVVAVSDGKAYHYNFWWYPTLSQGTLEVGETRTCHLTLALSAQAPPVWTFGFAIPLFFVDINPLNNYGWVTLRRATGAATDLPATSWISLVILAVLIVTAAGRRRTQALPAA